jgi:uncharacterized membrane protein
MHRWAMMAAAIATISSRISNAIVTIISPSLYVVTEILLLLDRTCHEVGEICILFKSIYAQFSTEFVYNALFFYTIEFSQTLSIIA